MTANERRAKVAEKYKTILGRNRYSQALRNYCFKKYSDGKYFSDCSSSICYTYKEVGEGFGIMNTVGLYGSEKLEQVPVKIDKGQILNPEVLRVGDMLLFAGTNSSRASAGYVGHVEMVFKVNATGGVTLCGHGSGTPSTKEMAAYCKQRYAKKSGTKLGHCGLIKVVRYIRDDVLCGDEPKGELLVKSGTWNVRIEPGTEHESIAQVHGGDVLKEISPEGWRIVRIGDKIGFISDAAAIDH